MRRFGEIVQSLGLATAEQVEQATRLQRTSHPLLGRILVRQNALTKARRAEVLSHADATGKRFGDACVELGACTAEQVAHALHTQKTSNALVGDMLIEMGLISEDDRVRIVHMQLDELRHQDTTD